MKKNVGGIDKVVRIIAGIVLAIVGLFAPIGGGVKAITLLVAIIALFTGIFGF